MSRLDPTPLSATTSATIGASGPTYERGDLRPAIVHIGVGGFHRAHLALYVDEVCHAGHRDWAIAGAGILPSDLAMFEALQPQDYLYTLIVRGATATELRVVGSIIDFVLGIDDLEPVVAQIADERTQIVSLTITEGGYPIDDTTGRYDPGLPTAGPHSAFAAIAAGLDRRRQAGLGPVTVMSCDNILGNGRAARTSTLGQAGRISDELAAWIADNVTFPNSMVDRITPATTEADRRWLATEHRIIDRWPVVTEPFRQWVIEDDFAADRLPLEDLDVIVTDDVEPYEFMKLRLLNAAHSCLAYLSALDGIESVHEAMAAPHIRAYVEAFLAIEARPMVPDVPGIDLDDYVAALVERFSNPGVGDQISRLCLDGSAKFPKFLVPTIRAQLAVGGPVERSALALAAWCQYLGGRDDRGRALTLSSDPNLDEAVAFAERSVAAPAAFVGFGVVFDDLDTDPRFVAAFTDALLALRRGGVPSAIKAALG